MNEPHPHAEEYPAKIHDAHRAAVASGEDGYFDPHTGLFVLTERYLAERGACCDSGCRHCPYGHDQ